MLQLLFLLLLFTQPLLALVKSQDLKVVLKQQEVEASGISYDQVIEALRESYIFSREIPAIVRNAPQEMQQKVKFRYWKAMHAFKEGDVDGALEILTQLNLRKDSTIYRKYIRYNIALIYSHLGDYKESIKTLTSSHILLSEEEELLLATCYIAEGDLKKAREALLRVKESVKAQEKATLMANIAHEEGELESAIELLEKEKLNYNESQGRASAVYLSQLYLEKGLEGKALKLMEHVLADLVVSDPYTEYIDSYLLTAQKARKPTKNIRLFIERLIEEKKDKKLNRVLRFTLVQLVTENEERLQILSDILKQERDDNVGHKACYTMMKIAMSLTDTQKSILWLQRCRQYSIEPALIAKILAELAQKSVGANKVSYYKQALKQAELDQVAVLRLNYNLSKFQKEGHHASQMVLSVDQKAHLLLEKAFQSPPHKAFTYYQRFFELNQTHENKGVAHLKYALLLLNKGDEVSVSTAKAHLKEVESRPAVLTSNRSEFWTAQAKVAVYERNVEGISKVLRQRIKDIDHLLEVGCDLYDKAFYHQSAIVFSRLSQQTIDEELEVLSLYYQAASHYRAQEITDFVQLIPKITRMKGDKESSVKRETLALLAYFYASHGDGQQALPLLDELVQTPVNKMITVQSLIGLGDEKSCQRARALLLELLKDPNLSNLERYKVVYKFITLLELQNKWGEILDVSYQVAYSEVVPPPDNEESWMIFHRVVKKCFGLWERESKWRTLYSLAKELAKKESPYRAEYQEKADQISLKHVLWDLN